MRLISRVIDVLNAFARLLVVGVVSLFVLSYSFDTYYNSIVDTKFNEFNSDVDHLLQMVTYDENGCVISTPQLIAQDDHLMQAINELQKLSQIGFELETLRPLSDKEILTEYVLDADDISSMRDLVTEINAALASPICSVTIPEPIPSNDLPI